MVRRLSRELSRASRRAAARAPALASRGLASRGGGGGIGSGGTRRARRRKAELAALKDKARRAAAARLERGRVCDSCGQRPEENTPLGRCDGCGGPRYCGDACRKAHWLAGHRDECAAGVAFIT